ncbi:hypothetical protein DEIPH_ctg017orf0224 [Deinococcus phoenicis]|uniref:Uncharacterized protein n=1 Tax=Deinococcus phoenicis TaxID=1476583 RepID=A0A016QS76_9DEIO|nr:hypothetical protein [Deinococcus phoenicis]EYB68846.1 hypothetical protein DEIPH_ctg017orf0224 [Deinococcus phoenicis]
MTAHQLDERGFVFLDLAHRPYLIRRWGGNPWLFYWHPDNHWVSLRRVNQAFIWQANARALPDDQAELYHQKQAEWASHLLPTSHKACP